MLWGWLWIGVSVSNVIRGVVMWARISIRDRDRIRITVRCLGHVRGRVQVWVHNHMLLMWVWVDMVRVCGVCGVCDVMHGVV